MIVVFLCIGIVAGTSYLGYVCACYYTNRKKFFDDFIAFLSFAKTQISCFQTRRKSIYEGFDSRGSDFEKIVKSYAKNLENCSGKLNDKLLYINEDEWAFVQQVLHDIGKADIEGELSRIALAKDRANAMLKSAEKQCEKKCALCVKLGAALGIFISILII